MGRNLGVWGIVLKADQARMGPAKERVLFFQDQEVSRARSTRALLIRAKGLDFI